MWFILKRFLCRRHWTTYFSHIPRVFTAKYFIPKFHLSQQTHPCSGSFGECFWYFDLLLLHKYFLAQMYVHKIFLIQTPNSVIWVYVCVAIEYCLPAVCVKWRSTTEFRILCTTSVVQYILESELCLPSSEKWLEAHLYKIPGDFFSARKKTNFVYRTTYLQE